MAGDPPGCNSQSGAKRITTPLLSADGQNQPSPRSHCHTQLRRAQVNAILFGGGMSGFLRSAII
ncbi:MAG TPA: hypothetical protein VIW67_21870, partial [Terriglobales bacterium]